AGNEEYFFHVSAFQGNWDSLTIGTKVAFKRGEQNDGRPCAIEVRPTGIEDGPGRSAENPIVTASKVRRRAPGGLGPYDGPTFQLLSEQRRQALTDISRWKLEARLDDIKRYFFIVPELNYIITGDASYVIGRKGTGKTALVQYLSDRSGGDLLVTKLTFKNFPFNELYSQVNEGYRKPNQYITIWKLIIYSAACRLMSQSTTLDPLTKRTIDRAFPPAETDHLGTIIGKWIASDFGLSVLGTGVNMGKWFKDKKQATLQEKVENLEGFVRKNIPRQKLMILFDELDEDYKEIFEDYSKSDYLDLLTSLFKAVQDIRVAFSGTSKSLYPVIFLRDDIYDLIRDPDKNKWRDLEVDLKWTDEGIRALLAHRLSRVMEKPESDFEQLWYSIFTKTPLSYSNGNKKIASFDYIKMSAQGRPRDYVNYLQECAEMELKRSGFEISGDTIKDADKAYSNYLKKELIDEIHGIIPDISTVLDIFSETRKWILSVDEFRRAYKERIAEGRMKVSDVEFVLRTLFYFSVIGNVARVGVHIFRHERPDAQLNFKEPIVVHRGLMKSLQII
ncbi:MAG: hypothetical protein ABIW83_02400, partial [Allosphingosinicella sp.]